MFKLRIIVNSWCWNFLCGLVTLLGFLGINGDFMLNFISNIPPKDIVQFIMLCITMVFFYKALMAKFRPDSLHKALYNFASNKDMVRFISKNGDDLTSSDVGNYTWKELAEWICKKMEIKHLHYSTLGKEYRLVDVKSGKVYKFQTGNELESKIEKAGIRNGQVLLFMER